MPKLSDKSSQLLSECDTRLQMLCRRAIDIMDFTVITGARNKSEQQQKVLQGLSETMDSKHNLTPSKAVDLAPYPIDWNDRDRFMILAGIMFGLAASLSIKIRWGGDWKGGFNPRNKSGDLGHFEIVGD